MPETNKQRAAKAAEAAKRSAAQKRAVPTTGRRGQANRDESALRVSKIHDPKTGNR